MAMHQFKAESKKLLDLMINSIYTNREIFLRELISNASDACDKRYFKSLTDTSIGITKDDLKIHIQPDKDSRTLTITDNGIGMTKEELEKNLGTIARSGSLDFKTENQSDNIDIIGQFGVGFYSAFMVAKKVTVISRAQGADTAWKWESTGVEGYTLTEADKEDVGTEIILVLKDDTDTDKYSEYLEDYELANLVKKYSDYIRFPITMYREKSRQKPKPEDAGDDYKPEYETYTELETLNSMVPIWKRPKNEVKDEDYNEFYKNKFMDYTDPLRVITSRTEGTATYTALLFIPGSTPYDYYTKEYEKGLALYASGVMIMEKCADLLPDYFSFVKGIVDSADLNLNISRETLQQDHQVRIIAKAIDRKIKSELKKMLTNDREKYEKFFDVFGVQIKWGVYSNYGAEKDGLKDLMMFKSVKNNKYVTLKEYVENMPEGQEKIYYACGEAPEKIALLPQTEAVTAKGFDVLCFTDDVDEFAVQMLMEYDGKQFANICKDDLNLSSDEEKKALTEKNEAAKEMLDEMKGWLGDDLTAVKFSDQLGTHAVCLSSEGYVSLDMAKILSRMPGANDGVKAQLVLEINKDHKVAEKLFDLFANDKAQLEKYTKILYNEARLVSGLEVENPTEFADMIADLM